MQRAARRPPERRAADVTDRMTVSQRSYTMSRIRSRNNQSTELRLLTQLRRARVTGWRRNYPLVGRPDVVFYQRRTAVFVDGCFWHGCPRCFVLPKSNVEYWRAKIDRNRTRDSRVGLSLAEQGWTVFRIWEHSLKEDPHATIVRLSTVLQRNDVSVLQGSGSSDRLRIRRVAEPARRVTRGRRPDQSPAELPPRVLPKPAGVRPSTVSGPPLPPGGSSIGSSKSDKFGLGSRRRALTVLIATS